MTIFLKAASAFEKTVYLKVHLTYSTCFSTTRLYWPPLTVGNSLSVKYIIHWIHKAILWEKHSPWSPTEAQDETLRHQQRRGRREKRRGFLSPYIRFKQNQSLEFVQAFQTNNLSGKQSFTTTVHVIFFQKQQHHFTDQRRIWEPEFVQVLSSGFELSFSGLWNMDMRQDKHYKPTKTPHAVIHLLNNIWGKPKLLPVNIFHGCYLSKGCQTEESR